MQEDWLSVYASVAYDSLPQSNDMKGEILLCSIYRAPLKTKNRSGAR